MMMIMIMMNMMMIMIITITKFLLLFAVKTVLVQCTYLVTFTKTMHIDFYICAVHEIVRGAPGLQYCKSSQCLKKIIWYIPVESVIRICT